MKKTLHLLGLLALCTLSQNTFAQWKGVVANVGYTVGSTKVKASGFDPIGGATWEQKRKHNVLTFGMMAAGGRVFFDMNGGFPVTKKDKIGNTFNTKLAFGGYVGKTIGVMVGGHYNYISYGAPVVPPPYKTSMEGKAGWNQRGVGAHLLLNPSGEEDGRMLLRLSLMKDWLRRDAKKYKGSGFTPEAALYLTFDDERSFGLQFTATYSALAWDAYKNGNNESVPENKISSFVFNMGLIFPLSACGSASSGGRTIITVTPK